MGDAMSIKRSRIELEIREVRFPETPGAKDWFASAHVVATDLDGRKTQGWVHVAKHRTSMSIGSYDEYDDVAPGLLGFVVATESDAIIAAVKARADAGAVRVPQRPSDATACARICAQEKGRKRSSWPLHRSFEPRG